MLYTLPQKGVTGHLMFSRQIPRYIDCALEELKDALRDISRRTSNITHPDLTKRDIREKIRARCISVNDDDRT